MPSALRFPAVSQGAGHTAGFREFRIRLNWNNVTDEDRRQSDSEAPESTTPVILSWRRSLPRADLTATCVCYLLASALFNQLMVSVVIGLIAAALYHCVYKRNPKVIALTISVVISFGIFQWAGGYIVRAMLTRTHGADVDHRMRPNNEQMQTNSDGLRCSVDADVFREEDANIVFIGDSFVYGERIEKTADVFPYVVASLLNERGGGPNVRSVSFGWTSSSPLLSLRMLKDKGPKYKPDLVILSLDVTDFHDDLKYQYGQQYVGLKAADFLAFKLKSSHMLDEMKERFRVTTVLNSVVVSDSIVPMDRFYIVNQPLSESEPFTKETERNLRDIDDYCRNELKCRFLVLLLPRHFQYSEKESPDNWEAEYYKPLGPYVLEPFNWLAQVDERTDFPCRSLLDAFRDASAFPLYLNNDPHWNVTGHRVAAEAIVNIIIQEGLLREAPHTMQADSPKSSTHTP